MRLIDRLLCRCFPTNPALSGFFIAQRTLYAPASSEQAPDRPLPPIPHPQCPMTV
ncbi:MAG: hypothetical protein IGS48_12510 [Oscillatoriales cyanobacterium C42_A2020_001]|nr:hypothetical protein [Leptolyngbyaceae cyanobacterium C42_A2020_001]